MKQKLLYNDDYFNYLFILMRYGAGVINRRIRVKIFIYLEYDNIKFAVINDKKRNRLIVYVYEREDKFFKYLGQINIYGYYPKQVRKIFYSLQKKIQENAEYRERLLSSTITISRKQSQNYKWFIKSQSFKNGGK